MADREIGTVKWYNDDKGYGFIKRKDVTDLFVHKNAIRNTGRSSLEIGRQVKFTAKQGKKGLQADDVVILV